MSGVESIVLNKLVEVDVNVITVIPGPDPEIEV
jgi:hypothetical protein